MIYFIQAISGGPIKIGYTRNRVLDRLRAIQTGVSEQIQILAVIEGARREEGALHLKFANLRLRGEWFRPEPMLLAHIASLPACPSTPRAFENATRPMPTHPLDRDGFSKAQSAALAKRVGRGKIVSGTRFAAVCGVSDDTVANWLRGRSLMDAREIEAAAIFFDGLNDSAFFAEIHGDLFRLRRQRADELEKQAAQLRSYAVSAGAAA